MNNDKLLELEQYNKHLDEVSHKIAYLNNKIENQLVIMLYNIRIRKKVDKQDLDILTKYYNDITKLYIESQRLNRLIINIEDELYEVR